MEQAKKNLKVTSWVVLLLAIYSFVEILVELIFGELNSAPIPEGAPDNILLITKTFLLVVALILVLPKVYVGIKGLRIVKNPKPGKAHIVWAGIILVFSALGLIEPITAIVAQGNLGDDMMAFFNVVVDVIIYYEYIKYAREFAKLAE